VTAGETTGAGAGAGSGGGAGGVRHEPIGPEPQVGQRLVQGYGPATKLAITLGFLTLVGLMVLALAGFTPAFYILVVAAVGALMIVVGARLR
jgi:hypothetical protein